MLSAAVMQQLAKTFAAASLSRRGSVHCSSDSRPLRAYTLRSGEKTMPNQSAKKPLQPETRTGGIPNHPEWKVPTLADLLQRLSVTSASPSPNPVR